ncbi:MAG: flagellar biosynthesis protein FliQ [Leptospiraceae bacterium]|nr:flagellar biosynthesis protein FliQ [Leptospiraceae bacterium]MCB1199165.1 flagellar biosynthesis protein FliQ [Leptospiraceae bacterium]
MVEADALNLLREALWVTLKMAGPIMAVSLIVGLIISVLQATTSIQEQTLTFVPKLIAIFVALLVFASYIGSTMGDYTRELFRMVARY